MKRMSLMHMHELAAATGRDLYIPIMSQRILTSGIWHEVWVAGQLMIGAGVVIEKLNVLPGGSTMVL